MEPQQSQDPVSSVLSDFSTRLNEIEEKQRLLKDRTLLIGQNLIATKEEFEKQATETRNQLRELEQETKSLNQLTKRILETLDELARKSDLDILARQAKMFQPLEFARIQDVKDIVKQELKKK